MYALTGLRAREQSGENGRLGVETRGEVCERIARKGMFSAQLDMPSSMTSETDR